MLQNVTSYRDHCGVQRNFECSKSSVTSHLVRNFVYPFITTYISQTFQVEPLRILLILTYLFSIG